MSEQHDWVRRLLAETGDSPEPMPAEVADRLDRVLDDLADSPRQPGEEHDVAVPAGAAVVPMTRRRHRRWGAALLAAAAITVGGYTLTATGVLGDFTGGGVGSQSTADSAGSAGEPESAADELTGAGPATRDDAGEGAASTSLRRLPSVSSATLRRDATALAAAAGADVASLRAGAQRPAKAGEGTRDESGEAGASVADRAACVAPPARARGTRLRVAYDGERATAVVRAGAPTIVEVWACDAPVRLARVAVRR